MEYARGQIDTLPQLEQKLKTHLEAQYKMEDWKAAIDAVFEAEKDEVAAVTAVERLRAAASKSNDGQLTSSTPVHVPHLQTLENSLLSSIDDLQQRTRTRGERPTLEDLLNPIEEDHIGHSPYDFPNGDADIIKLVKEGKGVDETAEVEDEGEEDKPEKEISPKEGGELCRMLERLCIQFSDAPGVDVLELQRQARRFRGYLRKEEEAAKQQVSLDKLWTK